MMHSRPLIPAAVLAMLFGVSPRLSAQSASAPPPVLPPAPGQSQQNPLPGGGALSDIMPRNGVAAIVESRVITYDEVQRELEYMLPSIQDEVVKAGGTQQDYINKVNDMVNQLVQNYIDKELVIKEFHKVVPGQPVKLIPSTFVESQISQIIATQFYNDRSQYVAWLAQRHMTMAEHRKETEEDIIYQYMLQQQRKTETVVSPVKIETYYRENIEQFRQPDRVHFRLIQLNRNEGETDAQFNARINALAARVRNGESFQDLARQYSQDKIGAPKGGDWGWHERSGVAERYIEPLFALKDGEMAEPIIEGNSGFLLYVEEREYEGIQPLDKVRPQIEQILVDQMGQADERRWLERLRRTGYVRLFL